MPSELHDELAKIGAAWLKRNGLAVVATDLTALGCRERADVIGFRAQCSAAIESKVSRADFFADRKKPHRESGGIGLYRFCICPAGLIAADELPARGGGYTSTGSALPKSPGRTGTSGLARKRISPAGLNGSTRQTTTLSAACCSRYRAGCRWANRS